MLLVGTKCDLISERKVSYNEAKEFAAKLGAAYIEISSKNSTNCELALAFLAQKIRTVEKSRLQQKQRTPTIPPPKRFERCDVQ